MFISIYVYLYINIFSIDVYIYSYIGTVNCSTFKILLMKLSGEKIIILDGSIVWIIVIEQKRTKKLAAMKAST